MEAVFQYIIKWSLALGVVYIFYRLVLRPLTFYQWNRRYLVLYSIIAFFIPFINLYTYVAPEKLQDVVLVQYIPVINIQTGVAEAPSRSFDPLVATGIVIAAGSLVLLVRLLVQWFSLRRIRRKAVRIYHPDANVYHVDEHVIPFSFGKDIFLNTSLHTEEELNDIILHEFVHVRQKHSFDIVWSEVLCMLNWYNPFAWCIRHAIRQNLEFIADQAVLKHGLDKKSYQYHLLKVIGSPQYSIANNFNFSSLKKRIAMMNRLKSARVHLVKFIFVLPLLAVLLVAFRNNKGWYQEVPVVTTTDTVKPEIVVTGHKLTLVSMKEFYQKNPNVKEVAWSENNEIVIYRKDGTREAYILDRQEDKKRFEVTYGPMPTVVSKNVILQPTKKSAPPVPAKPAFELPEGVSSVWIKKNILTIERKDGEKEIYNLSEPKEKEAAIQKYGEIVPLPETREVVVVTGKPVEVSKLKEVVVEGKPLPGRPAISEVVVQGVPTAPLKEVVVEGKPMPKAKAAEVPLPAKPVIKEVPKVIEVEGTPKKTKGVIQLDGTDEGPASVKVIDKDDNTSELYADRIVINAGEPEWYVKKQARLDPAYYVNGKRSSLQEASKMDPQMISHAEVVSNPKLMVQLGEAEHKSIINLITRDNAKNPAVYMAPSSKKTVEEAAEESRIANTLYMGLRNPITIIVDGGNDENVIVKMDGGTITKENGKYYAYPSRLGNVEIMIYKKEGNELKLINKRVFRVVTLPAPKLNT